MWSRLAIVLVLSSFFLPLRSQDAGLLKLASDAGVSEQEISKAIFEGRIQISVNEMRNIAQMLAPGKDMLEGYAQWNKRFGSLGDIQEARTIVNGKEVVFTGKDILLRLSMRLRGFQQATGLRADPALTYKDVVARLGADGDSVKALDAVLADLDRRNFVGSYFMYPDASPQHAFDLSGDYQAVLRKGLQLKEQADLQKEADAEAAAERQRAAQRASRAASAGSGTISSAGRGSVAKPSSCDALAGHPDDKEKIGNGVADEDIKPDAAIAACEAEALKTPSEPRLHFQLGRAYWAAERYDEALDAFLKAEEMDYAPAYFYIGMAYEDGLIDDKEPDLATARDMYMIAAAAGFEPAVSAYQDMEEAFQIDFTNLKKPGLMRAFYEGDTTRLGKDDFETLYYMRGMHDFLREDPEADGTCQALVEPQVSRDLNRATLWKAQDIGEKNDPFKIVAILGDIWDVRWTGEDDMFLLAGMAGGCNGPDVRKIYDTYKLILQKILKAQGQ